MAWKNAKGGFVYWLNRILNPDHQWYDYYDPTTGQMSPKDGAGSLRGDSATYGSTGSSYNSFLGTLGEGVNALINRWTDAHATQGEYERNEMQMQNQEDIYQRQVTGMQKAGINPALMYGSGASSGPSVTTSGSSPMSMSDLMSAITLPLQRKLMKSQSQMFQDQGKAALMQGEAALKNAGTNVGNLGVRQGELDVKRGELDALKERVGIERFDAETRRMEAETHKALADAQIPTEQARRDLMAQQMAQIKLSMEYLPKQVAIAKQNADAASRQAAASWENAMAAVQNAATNDRLADSQIALNAAHEAIEWAREEGQVIVNRYLDERQRTELDNLYKQGVHLDKQNQLVDKTGHLVDARTAATYVEMAATVNDAVYKWANPLSALGKQTPPAKVSFGSAAGLP